MRVEPNVWGLTVKCLPRYRYTPEGERIDNITDWALAQFVKHYEADGGDSSSSLPPAGRVDGKADREGVTKNPTRVNPPETAPRPLAALGPSPQWGGMKREITKDAIFHYVYGLTLDWILDQH